MVGLSRPAGTEEQGKTTKGDCGVRRRGGMEMIAASQGCCTAAVFYITLSHFQPYHMNTYISVAFPSLNKLDEIESV